MATKPPFWWVDPPLQPAAAAEVQLALGHFIQRFVLEGRRGRAGLIFRPGKRRGGPQALAALIDHGRAIALPAGRATPTAAQARALAGLNLGTAGVFMDDGGNCWTTWLGTALSELCDSDAIFAATDGRCAVVHFDVGDSLLLR